MISFFTHLIFSHSSLHTPSHIIFSYLISLYLLSIKQTSEVWSTCFIALAGITTPSYHGNQIHHQIEHHVYVPEYWHFPENLIISNKSLCLCARVMIVSKKLMFSISVCEEHQTNMIVILVIILWSWRLFDEKEQQSKQSSGWQKWGVQGYWQSSITENTRNTTSNKLPKNGRLSQAIIVGSSLWHCVSLWCSVRLGHIMPHYSHMEMWPR